MSSRIFHMYDHRTVRVQTGSKENPGPVIPPRKKPVQVWSPTTPLWTFPTYPTLEKADTHITIHWRGPSTGYTYMFIGWRNSFDSKILYLKKERKKKRENAYLNELNHLVFPQLPTPPVTVKMKSSIEDFGKSSVFTLLQTFQMGIPVLLNKLHQTRVGIVEIVSSKRPEKRCCRHPSVNVCTH